MFIKIAQKINKWDINSLIGRKFQYSDIFWHQLIQDSKSCRLANWTRQTSSIIPARKLLNIFQHMLSSTNIMWIDTILQEQHITLLLEEWQEEWQQKWLNNVLDRDGTVQYSLHKHQIWVRVIIYTTHT